MVQFLRLTSELGYCDVDHAALGESAECIKIAIKGLIFAIPFEIKSHAIFDVVNFMSVEKFLSNDFG